MQLRGATASHVGNVRETNQDRVHFGGYTGVVADGMGGHQGGEMAASIAISEFVEVIDPIAPGGLVDLVEEANRAVFEKAADPDLRGMGTTLVALTLRPAEEKISIVNVGDSRAYFLRGDEFGQLTLDHSLVEDLVRQNRLTPQEALTHPQRNILTRALGIASQVEVDRFLVPTQVGDRFLLCSDGLFNEVTEEGIVQILTEFSEPNEAADHLVEAALAAAGRDNVTVAVIDVVVDGEGGDFSSSAAETLLVPAVGPSDGGGSPVSQDGGAAELAYSAQGAVGVDVADPEQDLGDYEDTAAEGDDVGPVDDQLAPEQLDADESDIGAVSLDAAPALAGAGPPVEPDDTAELDALRPRKRSRRRGLLAALVIFALGALAGAGYVGVTRWADSQWYVDVTSEGQLAVFRGRPDGFLWTEPSREVVTEDRLDDLTTDAQNEVLARMDFTSQADAEAFIEDLEREPAVTEEDLEAATNSAAGVAVEDVADEIDDEGGQDGGSAPSGDTNTTEASGSTSVSTARSGSEPEPGAGDKTSDGEEPNTSNTRN